MLRTPHRLNNRGVALIAVLLTLTLLMALATAMTTSVNMDSGLRGAYTRTTTGFYAAESGLNRAMGDYRNIFLNFNVPTGSDFNAKSITVGNRTVNYQIRDNNTPAGTPTSLTIPSGQLFGGLNSLEYDYIVNSSAQSQSETEANVAAEFKVGYIPLFQFMAFYSRDLEIAPGANMTLNGRLHSNANLYLDADGPTLAIADNPPSITTVQVSAQGDIYRGRKRSNLCETPGTVNVDMLQDTVSPFGDLDPMTLPCNGSSTRKVPASELAAWKGSMVNQVESISVPQPDIDARGAGIYWTHADLRIVLKLGTPGQLPGGPVLPHSIVVEDVAGNIDVAKTTNLRTFMVNGAAGTFFANTRPIFYTDVPNGVAPCTCGDAFATGCNNATRTCYTPNFASDARVYGGTNMTADLDYRRGGFYNWREQKWMYLLNVNVRDLLKWNMDTWGVNPANALFDPADNTDGGIVLFLSVEGPNSGAAANNYGVRVFGSPTLPFPAIGAGGDPTGLTVVSDQAGYILGDYNNQPTVAAGWQPAAVITDSVNILSNNYFFAGAAAPAAGVHVNDWQSNDPLGATRTATATIVNSAFISGVDDTLAGGGAGGYNGGLENYPRFHESWSGITFTYRGSYVSLGLPQHVNGAWCGTGAGCNIYNPPTRNWNYDAQFNDVRYLPPLTPRFVYVQQVLFTEEFK